MGFVDVPVGREVGVGEIKVEFDDRVAAITARELEGVVVETVDADLPACVLGLVPEIGHHDAGPLPITDGGTDGSNHLNLPRTVVERLGNSIVAPLPFAF